MSQSDGMMQRSALIMARFARRENLRHWMVLHALGVVFFVVFAIVTHDLWFVVFACASALAFFLAYRKVQTGSSRGRVNDSP